MNALHLPTAYFIAGILYLCMPLAVWVVLRKHGIASNTLWCLGGLLFGLSLILLGMRGQWPNALTYHLAMGLLILGPMLRAAALRRELGRPLRWVWLGLVVTVYVAVFAYFHDVVHSDSWRFTWASLGAAASFLWLGLLARDLQMREKSVSAQWICVAYLLLSVLIILRIPSVMGGLGQPMAMTSDPLSAVLIFWAVVTAIVSNIGFLGLFFERLNRHAFEAAQMQARQEEALRLSEQIAQLDRRRSMGEMAATLAHELSQPLTNIYLITDRIETAQQQRQDDSLKVYLQDLHRNTQKASDILSRIRAFIEARGRRFERLELQRVVADVNAMLGDLTHHGTLALQVTLPPQSLAVQADPVQLSQIFMNVVRNAIQATQGQALRQLHIRVWQEGAMAHISLTDNGPGLPDAVLSHAGTAFFTTKSDGLGMGLSISKTIAQQHGGSLSIGNSSTGGAVVELKLPVVA